jgi:hypothetical protein
MRMAMRRMRAALIFFADTGGGHVAVITDLQFERRTGRRDLWEWRFALWDGFAWRAVRPLRRPRLAQLERAGRYDSKEA